MNKINKKEVPLYIICNWFNSFYFLKSSLLQIHYKYAVYYKLAAETDWQTAQNFSSNTEVVISPTELGEYDVCVKVKDLMGTIAKRYFTVKVTSLPL